MPMSFSMPPASRRALVFSMFLVMTSCSAQQMAVTVSSDMALLGGPVVPEVPLLVELWLLLLLLPGSRWIKSLMAYLPGGKRKLIKVLFPSHFSHIWLILQSNSLRKLCVVVRVYIFYDSSYTHAKGWYLTSICVECGYWWVNTSLNNIILYMTEKLYCPFTVFLNKCLVLLRWLAWITS